MDYRNNNITRSSRLLYQDLEYVSSDDIIEEVKNKLSSYFEANNVDESILYSRIRYCLSKLKFNHHPHKCSVLEVDKCRAELPDDFKKLCMALACFEEQCDVQPRHTEAIRTEEQHVCELNLCESACDVCHDDCGNMFKIVQKFDRGYQHTYTQFDVLCPTAKSYPQCQKNCFNFGSKSKNEIDIRNGVINTNFDKGLIYIEYVASLETNNSYLIPDQETIIEWIKADLIHEIFQTMYYNGTANIERRYGDAKQDLHIKAENAKSIYKRSEFFEYYNLANTLIKRYKRLSTNIWDSCIYSTSQYGRRYG